MKNKPLLKIIGNGMIILIVTVLTYKFFMWNYWKVEQAVSQAKKVLAAPSAVNLILSKNDTILFKKSFARNLQGDYYIINQFDITPYINGKIGHRFPLGVCINDQNKNYKTLYLHRFKTFNLVTVKGYHFVFTVSNCKIEDFLKIKKCLPFIIQSLFQEGIAGKICGCDSIMNDLFTSLTFMDLATI